MKLVDQEKMGEPFDIAQAFRVVGEHLDRARGLAEQALYGRVVFFFKRTWSNISILIHSDGYADEWGEDGPRNVVVQAVTSGKRDLARVAEGCGFRE
jgi:hypothetical protein